MAVISKGQTFATGDQVTASKLNALADNATFASGAVDNTSTQLSGGAIIVKDEGITTAKLDDDAVTTIKIADSNVTKAKIEDLADMKVLGNVSGSAAAPAEVGVLDEDDMTSDSATSLATQQSIKAYVDNQIKRSLFIYQSGGSTAISSGGNTTCPLTESFSEDSSMSVSSNIITLSAGTYLIKADANVGMTNDNQDNNATGAIVDTGNSDNVLIAGKMLHNYNDRSVETTHDFSCIGKITLSSSTTIALKFRTNDGTGSRIGYGATITGMGTPIHATVYIEKLG